ncbi:RBBP9/YdeN family alpha/beta hydrolase [Blastococcus goldschmidtiae]|uniref:Alpha/beta hydrolase n=1 Tax=Blastococcus goldschmidtiae TaxID=3075546 RepID=A0ABU2K268_9ACTN|nr:alpha/beta hydrolase [Blastococcus sp. DSM 46792]MDT0274438.1 alpha/beta hydrolase [Blastococcus sp. DSM 46792]
MSFLIVHGWENRRPEGHWQRWLAERLADDGHEVRYPQFPEPDVPVLGDWLDLLRSELDALGSDGERVLVCHSLAVLLWWQAAPSLGVLQPDRVLLVAPPSADVLRGYPEVAAFAPAGIETTPLPADLRAWVRLVASDDDPYFPGGAASLYAGTFGIDADVIPGGRHLDLPAGYGSWPSVRAWCTDPSVRIEGR